MLSKLQRLPREARDTLFLLLVMASVVLPQVGHLPVWCSFMTFSLMLWRADMAVLARPLPSRWWLLLLLSIAVAATYFSHKTLFGRDAGVTLVMVLMALKTLELRARRDIFVVFFLSFFALLTNFFYSQSLLIAAAMLLTLLGLLTALVNAHMPVGKPPLMQAARTAAWMAMLGAPIMLALFVLFPRIAPLWGIPSDAMSGRSGLSSSMRVGSIASLALDDSVAMRVRFEGPVPPASDLYFRGPVLSSFNGREWRALRATALLRVGPVLNLQALTPPVKYQVSLEPNNQAWLLLLDASARKPAVSGFEVSMTPELQWQLDRPVTELLRYNAESSLSYRYGPTQPSAGLQVYLELPPGQNPRTQQFATQLRSQPDLSSADTAQLVSAVQERLRNGGYRYTLDPGVYGEHSADEFWFDRKEGFCEHIASSFVILMRALGVPARIVTGYQGGELNPVDGYFVVRQSDAHAWAEVWIAGRGWQRVDPTGSVAPGRVGAMQRLQAPRGLIADALLGGMNPALLTQLRALWEATNNGWNQWVLNYTQGKQFNLLRDIGFESPSWEHLSYLIFGLVVLASLSGAAWTLLERQRQDPWLRLLGRVTVHLQKRGFRVATNTPPRRLAEQLKQQSDPNDLGAAALRDWLLRLEAQRYAANSKQMRALTALQNEFKQLRQPS